MYKNLKIQERLKKMFHSRCVACIHCRCYWSNYDAYYIYAV